MPISRRRFLSTGAAASLGLAAAPGAFAGRLAWAARTGTFTPIRRGVGTFTARGGTMGTLVRPGGLALVDAQFPETAQACYDGLAERAGLDAPRLDVLVNTHHHGDHTAGNAVLAPLADVHVAHANVPGLQQAAAGRARDAGRDAEPPTTASTTFVVRWGAEVGDETIALRYYGPAHTAGDALVHFEQADVAHLGDLVFNRRPPYVDVPAGCNPPAWIDTLETIHAAFSDETVFIFGHAHPDHPITGTRADVLWMRDFLTALSDYVRHGLDAGTPLDTLAAGRVPGFEDVYLDDRPGSLAGAIRAVHAYFSAG